MKKKKNKKKKKTPSPGDKNYIDWVNKWGKTKKTNKVSDYAPQEEKTPSNGWKTYNDSVNVIGPILGFIAFIFVVFAIIGFVTSGVEKGSKYLDKQNYKKERCAERAESASTNYAAKKIYKACMSN